MTDILIVVTPGVERIAYGRQPLESLLEGQELSDKHLRTSAVWNATRSGRH
ncbi:hypothetical protein [Microbispora triticiradicis]|uniref:hypothetical protein n=1 Tax=Microbispora triticiradicis TaxID=2200763 RepID=UPI001AD7D833|nr:hypothetical protein [Microbispora triticiradicis]